LLGVREALARLKANKNYQLQLWSKGGAAYAREMAEKWELTQYFESYGSKPDVAIDDLPEDAKPICLLGVPFNDAAQAVEDFVAESVDTALQPSRKLVDLVAEIQAEQSEVERLYGDLFCKDKNISHHPVPFFGNLDSAKILTIALNPSTTEFKPWRKWPKPPIEANELARRLSSYFQSIDPAPHPWFGDFQEALGIIGASYNINAAHLDLSPWPLLSPTTLKKQNNSAVLLGRYNTALQIGRERWLCKLIDCCKDKLKVVMIFDPFGDRAQDTKAMCIQAHPELCVEIFDGPDQAKLWCWERQDSLRKLLGSKVFLA
jgi:hypothetical protein